MTLLQIKNLCIKIVGINRGKDLTDQLPKEIWFKILDFLSLDDLCRVVLTSSHMYNMASDPFLWSNMTVRKSKLVSDGISNLLSIQRFARITKIYLSKTNPTKEQCNSLFAYIGSGSSLIDELDLKCVDLSGVSSNLLAQAVLILRKVNLGMAVLSTEQLEVILTASITSQTLEEMDLYCVNLSEVDADILAEAMSKLINFNLSATQLTTPQLVSLFSSMIKSETLKEVMLVSINLRELQDDLVASALAGLAKVNLSWCQLNPNQLTAILQAIAGSSSLEDVNLGNVNLSLINADVLAEAVFSLVKVNLEETQLTVHQISTIMKYDASSNLQHLILRGNPNMRHVSKWTIQKGKVKLTSGLIYRF